MAESVKLDNKNNFLYRFLEIAEKYPENPAVIENGHKIITYKDLLKNALKIASFLNAKNCGAFIGISLEKSSEYIAVMLGCWFAGKAFVPLGKTLPDNRRKYIQDDAGIDYVFSETDYQVSMDFPPLDKENFNIEYNQPAYVIYTSGSTGKPKGVLVSHNGIVNLADCQRKAFEVDENSRYLFYVSVNFDASISDISVCLLSGAALLIENESSLDIASSLMRLIYARQITHMDIPPSLLKLLDAEKITDSLKTVVIGGEACDIETVRKWADKVNLVNVYGPTEATVCTSLCKCTGDWSEPLLGNPIDNIEYEVFAEGKLCTICEKGELFISGIGLALGYVNNEELTSKKFVTVNNKKYYRTGDLVEKKENGLIKFLGRTDRQVKIRGQLVELEEIENRLNLHPDIYKCSVLKRPLFAGGSDNLTAFVQLKNPLSENDLKIYLKEFLPQWMIPAKIEILNEMPLTVTGKINQDYLKNYEFKNYKPAKENLTETEKKVIDIFKKIIGTDYVSVKDNFFDLGGSSLDALELIFACKNLGLTISSDMLSENATPEFIANNFQNSQSVMVMDVEELKSDMEFIPDFEIAEKTPENTNNIFLTGATGFLGSALLKELLDTTQYKFYCLVRASCNAEGLERIKKTFKTYSVEFKKEYESRIEIICGDISKDNLGLSDEMYSFLAGNVFRIYHCAAVVNMLYPYEKLKNINVNGVKRILKFALTGVKKELHYASTLSVFVSTDKNTGTVYENDRLDNIKFIWGGYGQSKFAAEKYLLNANLDNIYIYRFGLICGNSQNGVSSKNDFLGMFVKGAAEFNSLPYDESEQMEVDITPVDYAVKCVSSISQSITDKSIFHVANSAALKYNDFIQIMKNERIIDRITDYKTWVDGTSKNACSLNEQACIMSLCRMDTSKFKIYRFMDLFQATGIIFDAENTKKITGLSCPCADENLIKKYLKSGGVKCLQD